MIVVWLFLATPQVCLQFVIMVFPDCTHLLFFHIKYVVVPACKAKCNVVII